MTKKLTKILTDFPELDAAVREKFPGIECETAYSIIEMAHVTNYGAEGEEKVRVEMFIAGFMAGNRELAARISA